MNTEEENETIEVKYARKTFWATVFIGIITFIIAVSSLYVAHEQYELSEKQAQPNISLNTTSSEVQVVNSGGAITIIENPDECVYLACSSNKNLNLRDNGLVGLKGAYSTSINTHSGTGVIYKMTSNYYKYVDVNAIKEEMEKDLNTNINISVGMSFQCFEKSPVGSEVYKDATLIDGTHYIYGIGSNGEYGNEGLYFLGNKFQTVQLTNNTNENTKIIVDYLLNKNQPSY